jgi:hypothetical protein
MKNYILGILLLALSICSCFQTNQIKSESGMLRLNHIRHIIKISGFVKLPLRFDTQNVLVSNYLIDLKGADSLIFNSIDRNFIGFLPDTTNYYACLFYEIGDILYPYIMTISKQGAIIDRQSICAGQCIDHVPVDVISCYDSVSLNKELNIKSVNKIIGTVEIIDTLTNTNKTINICNMWTVNGILDKNGKIILNRSEIIDCGNQ